MNLLLALFASLLAAGGAGGSGSSTAAASTPDDSDSGSGSGGDDKSPDLMASLTSPETTFYSEDGVLVLEAESGFASGAWEEKTVDGEQVMLWDAESNSYGSAKDTEALSFEFVAEEAGTYFIAIHGGRVSSAMDAEDVRNDTGNDSYVKITNLESGEVILDPTKLFVGLGDADEELKWGQTFDKDHVKSQSKINLEEETAYRLDLIGRSDGHMIDRVTLAKDGFLRDTEVEESALLLDQLTLSEVPESELVVLADTEEDMLDLL